MKVEEVKSIYKTENNLKKFQENEKNKKRHFNNISFSNFWNDLNSSEENVSETTIIISNNKIEIKSVELPNYENEVQKNINKYWVNKIYSN